MATLIAVYNSAGCVGRWDAKCYQATSPRTECECICGGRNHGAGYKQALTNTREHASGWLQQYAKRHGYDRKRVEELLGAGLAQASLFGD